MPDITALTSKFPLRVDTRPPLLGKPYEPLTAHPPAGTPSSRDDRDPLELTKLNKKLATNHAQILERMAAQPEGTEIVLWSAGNVRIGGRDMTLQAMDAVILYSLLRKDNRFARLDLKYFDDEGHEWKLVYHRTAVREAGLERAETVASDRTASQHAEDSMYLTARGRAC